MGAATKPEYAAGLNAALFKALSNPLRYRILMIAGDRDVSPTELAELLNEPFKKVYDQVRVLANADPQLLKLVGTDIRLGGEQHFYRAAVRPLVDAEAWEQLPLLAREATTAVNCGVIIGEIAASVEAGRFDKHPNRTIVRRPVCVDGEGAKAIEDAAVAFDEACERAQLESEERGATEDSGVDMLAATFLFQRASG